ncbi:MAG: peptidylprolyl isomerase [Clostridia bacterium]|nr:peptidylprolyl isomerase [Clostridia bacterium]
MKKIVKIISALLLSAVLVTLFASCGSEKDGGGSTYEVTHTVEMVIKDKGTIKLELYGNLAPKTVENFVSLANDGFYDGLIFHRVDSKFVIQGGDPEGTGYGGSGKAIYGEFTANGFDNPLSHDRGVISMARLGNNYDSATSQFFICLNSDYKSSLDGQYASFGRVTEGMDVVDAIAAVSVNGNNKPLADVVIESVKVTTVK